MSQTEDDYREMIDRLGASRRVIVTTHVRPDGDALGTAAAMVLGLRARNIPAHVLLLSHLPSKYAFIFDECQIDYTNVEQGWPAEFSLNDFDTLLVVDTGTWSQLPGMRDRVAAFPGVKLVVDHHLTQENWADAKLVVTTAGAAAEIAAELLARWDVPLNPPLAQALFVAIVSDTGWFQYSNTRPVTLRLAASLVEAGVDTDRIYQLLYQNERPQRVLLQTRAMQSLELLADSRLAVMQVRREDFLTAGAGQGDTENLINFPLQIRSIEVSILLTEPVDAGPIRVSLRSKGSVDVARFAEKFAGGGHARAAGLKVDCGLQAARDKVVSVMLESLTNAE